MSNLRFKTTLWIGAFVLLMTLPLAAATDKVTRKVEAATDVYRELLEAPDREIPEELIKKANCIGDTPHVVKGAFAWGGRRFWLWTYIAHTLLYFVAGVPPKNSVRVAT